MKDISSIEKTSKQPRDCARSDAGSQTAAKGSPQSNGSSDPSRVVTAWSPLRNKGFRMLWIAWFTASTCMWMCDVTAAWLMTTLTRQSVFVALVQTASTLPIFLLALPCGAIADMVDRRRWFLGTLLWLGITSTMLALASGSGILSEPLLLALVFSNGMGMAMRWTVFSSIVPDVVSRDELPQALALHSMAVNASRIIGPVVAGALLAAIGSTLVFAMSAVLSLAAAVVIWRWRYLRPPHAVSGESLIGAMQTGLHYAVNSRPLRVAMARIFVVCLQVFPLMALLPLVVKGMGYGRAETYTMLFSCMGIGAIVVGIGMPHVRGRFDAQTVVTTGALLQAIAIAIVALAPNPWVAAPGMLLAGGTWLALSNAISVSAQLSLPDWGRARGMAIFMMAAMAGSALGPALFGAVADRTGVHCSLLLLSAVAFAMLWVLRNWRLEVN